MLDGLLQAVSFGANEQVMTLMCALTGFLSKDKKHIIYVLAITAIASSIPDVYSYYRENASKKDVSTLSAAGLGLCVFAMELIVAVILGLPLLLLKGKKKIVMCTYAMGLALIAVNEMYLLKNSFGTTLFAAVFAMCAVGISYLASKRIGKIFHVKEN
jgi:hypothetical protein